MTGDSESGAAGDSESGAGAGYSEPGTATGDSSTGPSARESTGPSVEDSAGDDGTPRWLAVTRADANRCRGVRLHWLTVGVLGGALASAAVAVAALSAAFWTSGDLEGFVALITSNASWLFTSIFALVGLFVVYPGRDRLSATHQSDRSDAGATVVGVLLSRWAFVAGGSLAGFTTVLVVGAVAFEAFSIPVFAGFALVTTASVLAYVSVGVGLATVTGSDERFVLSVLSVYFALAFLWDTALAPTVATMALTGDPDGAIGTPPGWYDGLLAASPGGAHRVLSEAILSGSVGGLEGFAAVALAAWLVGPPAVGAVLVGRNR